MGGVTIYIYIYIYRVEGCKVFLRRQQVTYFELEGLGLSVGRLEGLGA